MALLQAEIRMIRKMWC